MNSCKGCSHCVPLDRFRNWCTHPTYKEPVIEFTRQGCDQFSYKEKSQLASNLERKTQETIEKRDTKVYEKRNCYISPSRRITYPKAKTVDAFVELLSSQAKKQKEMGKIKFFSEENYNSRKG